MKILIVDDEAPARDRLKRLIADIGHDVVGEASNGMEAVQLFNMRQPDIVLMDIRMPVMDGIEAAQHLSKHDSPPAVIFTTAYGDHALQAFDAHAVGYLLKPIRKESLSNTLETAQRPTRAQMSDAMSEARTEDEFGRQHICVRQRGNLELIPIADICYFYAEHKYVTLRYSDGEVLIEESLVSLEKEFGDRFLRIHRNCLIAMDRLHGLEKVPDGTHKVTLIDCDDKLEVSRRHLSTVRKILRGKI